MKKYLFLMCILSLFLPIIAEITVPYQLNISDRPIQIESRGGILQSNQDIELSFLEKAGDFVRVCFTVYNTENETYSKVVIDSTLYIEKIMKPQIFKPSNQQTDIFYTKFIPHSNTIKLYKAQLENLSIIETIEYCTVNSANVKIVNISDNYLIQFNNPASEQLSKFMLFTDKEISNLTDVPGSPSGVIAYAVIDTLRGPVHSNTDIYIELNNFGHPRFTSTVTTAGEINTPMYSDSDIPYEQVFLGGLVENSDYIELIDEFDFSNCLTPFGLEPSDNLDIIYIDMVDGIANIKTGNIVDGTPFELTIHSSYPDPIHPNEPIGDSLGVNIITPKETIWSDFSQIDLRNRSVYFPATVWIRGSVEETVNIYTPKDAYLIGDITYTNTVPGELPYDEENSNLNTTDYFALVSGGSIFIKYKHFDPETGEKIYDNSQGKDSNIYFYGAYAALGREDVNLGENYFRTEGVFTFEYMHPAGATPDFIGTSPFTGQDTLFTYIDLRKYKFPPESPYTPNLPRWMKWPGRHTPNFIDYYPLITSYGYPYVNIEAPYYYSLLDYPWYNPVWPEKAPDNLNNPNPETDIVYLRGKVNLFGSIVQRRKGFMKRRGSGGINNIDQNVFWDIDNYIYAGSPFTRGYDRSYIHDQRLSTSPFEIFPYHETGYNQLKIRSLNNQINIMSDLNKLSEDEIFSFTNNESVFTSAIHYDMSKIIVFEHCENTRLAQNIYSIDYPQLISIHDFFVQNDFLYYLVKTSPETLNLLIFNTQNQELIATEISNIYYNNERSQFFVISEDKQNSSLMFFIPAFQELKFYQIQNNTIHDLNSFTFSNQIENFMIKDYSLELRSDNILNIYLQVNYLNTLPEWSKLYLASADIGVLVSDSDIIIPNINFSVNYYPNPFNPLTNIKLELPEDQHIEISIYNIKGQKVKELHNGKLTKGAHYFIFDSLDSNNRKLASGIYFSKVKSQNYNQVNKLLLLK